MTEHEAVTLAVKVLGGQSSTAKKLTERMGRKIAQSHVYNWLNRDKRLPERYALHVEALTRQEGTEVKASDLCHAMFSIA